MDKVPNFGGLIPSSLLGQVQKTNLDKTGDIRTSQVPGTPMDTANIGYYLFSPWNLLPDIETILGQIFGKKPDSSFPLPFPFPSDPKPIAPMYGVFPKPIKPDPINPTPIRPMYGVFPDLPKPIPGKPLPIAPMYGVFPKPGNPGAKEPPNIHAMYGVFH
ncbi:MAG: hypothetical protein M1269_10620 [Chloroflexi bacterium]|nr:hypothetical protein [Chloroflexota bacterium]